MDVDSPDLAGAIGAAIGSCVVVPGRSRYEETDHPAVISGYEADLPWVVRAGDLHAVMSHPVGHVLAQVVEVTIGHDAAVGHLPGPDVSLGHGGGIIDGGVAHDHAGCLHA